jgi:hypothetical protein
MRPRTNKVETDEEHWIPVTVYLVSIFLMLGITLIALSFRFSADSLIREVMKELGIVLISVFSISIIYERFVARQHFERFSGELVSIIERRETIAAICSTLGVDRIFPTRSLYIDHYPFRELCDQMAEGSKLRIIGTSLFVVSYHFDKLLEAMHRGAVIELGVLDETVPAEVFEQIDHSVSKGELTTAMERFEKFKIKVAETKPSGEIQIRAHRMPLLDSFLEYKGTKEKFAIWDLSFGRDPSQKRVFQLNTARPFGNDLAGRYHRIWESGKTVFKYSERS